MLQGSNRQTQSQHLQQQQQHILEQTDATHGSHIYAVEGQEEETEQQETHLNFGSFNELCRLCAIHQGATKLHIFESAAEQRQLLYKLRTLLQANVSNMQHATCNTQCVASLEL